MKVSVIIPTYHEEENIAALIRHLYRHADERLLEIIVADGQSGDATVRLAREAGAATIICPGKGRAPQMNHAAFLAKGDVLYFVHADTIPPASYLSDIKAGLDEGFLLGGYRSEYLSNNPLFKVNAWFTRSGRSYSHGGDQTLYVYRVLFEKMKGFCEKHVIMEDFDFVKRASKVAAFKKIPKNALISTRKYEHNSFVRVTLANFVVFNLYRMGVDPGRLKHIYGKLLHTPAPKKNV